MKIPHTFTIVFSILIICAIATWFVPGGEFSRETVNIDGIERSIVKGDTFQYTESQPQTWQVFLSFFKGFSRTAHIISFIFMLFH